MAATAPHLAEPAGYHVRNITAANFYSHRSLEQDPGRRSSYHRHWRSWSCIRVLLHPWILGSTPSATFLHWSPRWRLRSCKRYRTSAWRHSHRPSLMEMVFLDQSAVWRRCCVSHHILIPHPSSPIHESGSLSLLVREDPTDGHIRSDSLPRSASDAALGAAMGRYIEDMAIDYGHPALGILWRGGNRLPCLRVHPGRSSHDRLLADTAEDGLVRGSLHMLVSELSPKLGSWCALLTFSASAHLSSYWSTSCPCTSRLC